ncbi:MAG TPA: MFS transporter [Rhodanobacteraceae bacterium]
MSHQHWREAWRNLAQPATLPMLFFGFGSAMPFVLVGHQAMALWLKHSGYALAAITVLTGGAGAAYMFKFAWAPLVDRVALPVLSRLGQRRSWLVLAQACVLAGFVAMALVTPAHETAFVACAVFTAFAGATQDIVLAAYRIEIAPVDAQAGLAAAVILGYRFGMMVGAGLALVMADHMSWSWVYVVMAGCMVIPVVVTLLVREPQVLHERATHWAMNLFDGIVMPFVDFFRRYKWRLGIGLLAFLLLFKISDQALAGGLIGPFYRAVGFTKTQIGVVSGFYGIWIGIAGAFVGGIAVARFGIRRCLWAGMILAAVSNLLYVMLACHHGSLTAFYLTLTGENLSGGFLGTVAVAYLSALVSQRYTATQYALFDSLINVPARLLGMASGSLVLWFSAAPEATMAGYADYFTLTTVAIVPALVLFVWLGPRVRLGGDPAK